MRIDKHGKPVSDADILAWTKHVLDQMKTPGVWIIPRSRLKIEKLDNGGIRMTDVSRSDYLGVLEEAASAETDENASVIRDKESLDSAIAIWDSDIFDDQRMQDILDMTHYIPRAGYVLTTEFSQLVDDQLQAAQQEADTNE